MIKGRKIVLIGGAGFIGHNLALSLKKMGAEVAVIDSLQVNNLLYFKSTDTDIPNKNLYTKFIQRRLDLLSQAEIPLHIEDARDYFRLSKILSDLSPQVVIQLAAVAHANRSNKDPYSTFDHSFRTLENALDACRESIEHFIYFSSSMVYGHFNEKEVTEDSSCNPIGIYGALKYSGEKIVIAYNQVFGLPYTIIRPSALYGEGCVSRRVGQIFIENALQEKPVVVHGDGSDRLDFTYIDDLIHGVSCILENENSKNQIFNLTHGASRSIGDVAQIISQEFPNVEIQYKGKDSLTPDRGTLSVEKAKQLIGYNPSFPIERGFERYINWYRDFHQ